MEIKTKDAATQLRRQCLHWHVAAERLVRLDELSSTSSWQVLEHYLGIKIRQQLSGAAETLTKRTTILLRSLSAQSVDLSTARQTLLGIRQSYLRTEKTIDFFVDAIASRASPEITAALRGCDRIANHAMRQALEPLNKRTPPVLTYIDKGLGASILKAGLRLWDGGTINPVAAIKVVRHNLHRPTALLHESGHQVAHMLGWNGELADALEDLLLKRNSASASIWAGWSSELAADVFGFVHGGYASILGLHDVLAGSSDFVFRYTNHAPHPVSYLRVLLGTQLCQDSYGDGPWQALRNSWVKAYPMEQAPEPVRELIRDSLPHIPEISELLLSRPMNSFNGQSLIELIDPQRVSPDNLKSLGDSIQRGVSSARLIDQESVRMLALSGMNFAANTQPLLRAATSQFRWLQHLGTASQAA